MTAGLEAVKPRDVREYRQTEFRNQIDFLNATYTASNIPEIMKIEVHQKGAKQKQITTSQFELCQCAHKAEFIPEIMVKH